MNGGDMSQEPFNYGDRVRSLSTGHHGVVVGTRPLLGGVPPGFHYKIRVVWDNNVAGYSWYWNFEVEKLGVLDLMAEIA